MKRMYVKSKGKKYLVNVPTYADLDIGISSAGEAAGSLVFGGVNQFLSTTGSSNWAPGTGSFTIEWFSYATAAPINARIFTVGVWPNAEIGVSIETYSGRLGFFLWEDKLGNTPAIANSGSIILPYLNTWHHFAVVRSSGSYLRIFQDGTPIKTISDPANVYIMANINDTTRSLTIGGEGDNAYNTRFTGSITNFRWVNGYALYSQSFDVPTIPLQAVDGTKLLILAATEATAFIDSSGLGNPITSSAVSWSYVIPPN